MITPTTTLLDLLRKQHDHCFWCQCLIGIPDCFKRYTLTCRTHWEFGVLRDGVVTYYGRASIDHLIPRWLKGGNKESNLVAACQECNHDRGVLHKPGAFETTGMAEWVLRKRDLMEQRKERLQARRFKFTITPRLVTLREQVITAMQNRIAQ